MRARCASEHLDSAMTVLRGFLLLFFDASCFYSSTLFASFLRRFLLLFFYLCFQYFRRSSHDLRTVSKMQRAGFVSKRKNPRLHLRAFFFLDYQIASEIKKLTSFRTKLENFAFGGHPSPTKAAFPSHNSLNSAAFTISS